MTKINITNEFDCVLLNAQVLRRCTRVNITQLVMLSVLLVSVFYIGRYSHSCDSYEQINSSEVTENPNVTVLNTQDEPQSIVNNLEEYMDILSHRIKCYDKANDFRIERKGPFWVLKNYFPANTRPKCYETVTYTTHGDFSFLDNLIPLIQRWMAPISIAIYAPGTDYEIALDSVLYLRNCATERKLIQEFVTFHLYFDRIHTPINIIRNISLYESTYECGVVPPFMDVSHESMYKFKHNLTYPVNVGRNIARETALTHFVLPSDIELYPNPDLATQFLKMYSKMEDMDVNEVFVLPIFEIQKGENPPETKSQLQQMLTAELAVPFHYKICAQCHSVPGQKEWIEAEPSEMKIHATSKRIGKFVHWEPIFIGTHTEPLYEEMLSWEGKSDKMTQGYVLCVLDYDFHVLSEGFLIHRPGIKTISEAKRPEMERKSLKLIHTEIVPQIERLYGKRNGCKP